MATSWTAMANKAAGDLVTEADMDAIRGNIEYLLTPTTDSVALTTGNITVTDTSWIDLAGVGVNLTTNGGHIHVEFCIQWSHDTLGGHAVFGIELDGTEEGGTSGVYDEEAEVQNRLHEASVAYTILAPSVAAHAIKVRVKTNAGNLTVYAGAGRPAILKVYEV